LQVYSQLSLKLCDDNDDNFRILTLFFEDQKKTFRTPKKLKNEDISPKKAY